MKIIAGTWRGRAIQAPSGTAVRPTSGRLREALFSALQHRLAGATLVDLFAGSGALGIEALSRGVAHVEFVESDARALRVLRTNLERLGVPAALTRIHRGDAWRRLAELVEEARPERIILLDPPYEDDLPERCLPAGLAAVDSGRIRAFVLEHPASAPEPELAVPAGVDLRRRRHGHGAFTLVTRSDR